MAPVTGSSMHLFFLCCLFLKFMPQTGAEPDGVFCYEDRGNYTANSIYQTNLNTLLSTLSSHTKINYGFYNFSYGQSTDRVNAIGLCRGDVKPDECRSCLNNSRGSLTENCPNQKEAVLWFDKCMLRYSNRTIFGIVDTDPPLYTWYGDKATNVDQFIQVLWNLMGNLKATAASGDSRRKYATGNATASNFQNIYGFVQCTPDLSQQECRDCLDLAFSEARTCCDGRRGARIMAPTCNIKYDYYRFFEETTVLDPEVPPVPPLPPKGQGSVLCDFNKVGNYTINGTYHKNLNTLLSTLTNSNTEINCGFYNMSYGKGPNRVNAIGLCRGDVEADECRSYLNDSRGNLAQSCPNQKEAVLWDEKCMLRYSNRSIFRLAEPSPSFVLVNPSSATNVEQFNEVLNNMLRNLADRAASGDSCRKYATQDTTWTNSQHIYGLVQCTPDLSPTDCKSCLVGAIEYIQTSICSDAKIGCRILRPSCNVRYENYPFSQQTTTPPPPTSHHVNTEEFHYFCDGNNDRGNYSTNDRYDTNLKFVLTMATLRAAYNSNNGFNGSWRGENADKVYAIAQCRGDVTPTECRQCLSRSRLNLTRLCPNRKEAIGWDEDEKCMLRYSDRSILGLNEIGPAYFVWNLHDAPNPQQFNQVVNNLLNRLKAQAVSSLSPPKYAASTATGPDGQLVYGLAQCTLDLSGPQCDSCLDQSIAEIPRCCNNRIGARIVRPSCYVRYETDFPFYGSPPQKP